MAREEVPDTVNWADMYKKLLADLAVLAAEDKLAERFQVWRNEGRVVVFLIGGPDGLDPALKGGADETLRLSDLTLPHAFARVLLAEALYRAWSLAIGHPYHRE